MDRRKDWLVVKLDKLDARIKQLTLVLEVTTNSHRDKLIYSRNALIAKREEVKTKIKGRTKYEPVSCI